MTENPIFRIKELITKIQNADTAYYRDDDPIMTDREYDLLLDELKELERKTGLVFANSPTKRVGGGNKAELKKVKHTKRMRSAQKTKSREELFRFANGQEILLSWKMDGLTLVLRYEQGKLKQAITRGEDGLIGEDVTKNVKCIETVPKTIPCQESFEVRGEGVMAWTDFQFYNRGNKQSHPRNAASGAVRATCPDTAKLKHMDFFAFELIAPESEYRKKEEQLAFLSMQGFTIVPYYLLPEETDEETFMKSLDRFDPKQFEYPVDGIIAEFNDIDYGISMGATEHHENRMMALKWEDDLFNTVFRKIELSTGGDGTMKLTAEFDPVMIDGTEVKRAEIHSIASFENLELGEGDTIQVYKANMIIPQIADNLTRSNTYVLPDRCPCCGEKLEIRIADSGKKNLLCPNPDCMGRNAQILAKYCGKDAMDIQGLTAARLELMMGYGVINSMADIYHLVQKKDRFLAIPGLGHEVFNQLQMEIQKSRICHLHQFLCGMNLKFMKKYAAMEIDDYFDGSWAALSKALDENFPLYHIGNVSKNLSDELHAWYRDPEQKKIWEPLVKELTFHKDNAIIGTLDNPFKNATFCITGKINGMDEASTEELLHLLGVFITSRVTKGIHYVLIGEDPDPGVIRDALLQQIPTLTQSQFAMMLGKSSVP